MSKFRDGQEVEVREYCDYYDWRKAKIVENQGKPDVNLDVWNVNHDYYQVQFPDGTRGVFEEAHIRAVEQECAHSASITTADGEGAYCRDCGETTA
jgi:hypothetical protein